jgi:superfamily II RNA helicase
MLTGDASINPEAPLLCCTAEVLSNLALRRGSELAVMSAVLDEFHYYGDAARGVVYGGVHLDLVRLLRQGGQ